MQYSVTTDIYMYFMSCYTVIKITLIYISC